MTEIETGTDHLLARVEDGVAVLTLNRPERRNALFEQMIAALAATLERVEGDDAVGAVVLTGAGGAARYQRTPVADAQADHCGGAGAGVRGRTGQARVGTEISAAMVGRRPDVR